MSTTLSTSFKDNHTILFYIFGLSRDELRYYAWCRNRASILFCCNYDYVGRPNYIVICVLTKNFGNYI